MYEKVHVWQFMAYKYLRKDHKDLLYVELTSASISYVSEVNVLKSADNILLCHSSSCS